MRTFYIERLTCQRQVPYDPDDHSDLEREGLVSTELLAIESGILRLRANFSYKVKGKKDGTTWGTLEGAGIITVKDPSIEPTPDGKGAKAGDNIAQVVEGTITDEFLLPITHLLRAMHLPGMLFLPKEEQPATAQAGRKRA